LNKVCLIGHVGRDVEMRFTAGGDPIASFSLATSEKWTDKGGNKHERTEWHNVSVFGKLAEIARDYVSKGRQVYVEGSLRTDEWTDKEGQKRKATKVNLSGPRAVLVLLGSGGRGESAPASSSRQAPPPDDFQADDDDLPF
jgi:single-strand DNA-binding protein